LLALAVRQGNRARAVHAEALHLDQTRMDGAMFQQAVAFVSSVMVGGADAAGHWHDLVGGDVVLATLQAWQLVAQSAGPSFRGIATLDLSGNCLIDTDVSTLCAALAADSPFGSVKKLTVLSGNASWDAAVFASSLVSCASTLGALQTVDDIPVRAMLDGSLIHLDVGPVQASRLRFLCPFLTRPTSTVKVIRGCVPVPFEVARDNDAQMQHLCRAWQGLFACPVFAFDLRATRQGDPQSVFRALTPGFVVDDSDESDVFRSAIAAAPVDVMATCTIRRVHLCFDAASREQVDADIASLLSAAGGDKMVSVTFEDENAVLGGHTANALISLFRLNTSLQRFSPLQDELVARCHGPLQSKLLDAIRISVVTSDPRHSMLPLATRLALRRGLGLPVPRDNASSACAGEVNFFVPWTELPAASTWERIGAGAFGVVYRLHWRGQWVCIKTIASANSEELEHAFREFALSFEISSEVRLWAVVCVVMVCGDGVR
jgi:hypothetical protein